MHVYVLLFSTTEVFKQGVWQTLKEIDDPELTRLAEELPTTVLRSRVQSSMKKYIGGFVLSSHEE